MAEKYDLVIIGSGPGGYVAAIRASQLGLKVACIERAELGGICLNWGCIPTKALLHSASLFRELKDAQRFGVIVDEPGIDFTKMVKHSRTVANRLSKGIEFLFRKNKVETLLGEGKVVAKGKIEITQSDKSKITVETKNILIATGARPRSLPGIKFDGKQIISSKEAMVQKKKPESMVIIGAGAIGVEFAYFYSSIGTKVTLIEMMPQILPIEDAEIAQVVAKSFQKAGIKILTDTKVESVKKDGDNIVVTVNTKEGSAKIETDITLVAIGVQGNVEGLGLEEQGVQIVKGAIQVNKKTFRTNADGIYAIGDVIGPPWLAHVASAEGIAAVEQIAGKEHAELDYSNVPGCTYCQPQVASLGLTEQKAIDAGYEIKVGRFPVRANGKALAMGRSDGLAKLIFDAKYGELLGAHLVGPEVTEMLAELNVAKTLETTADEIMNTMHAHPTISEMIKEAAEDAFGKAIHI